MADSGNGRQMKNGRKHQIVKTGLLVAGILIAIAGVVFTVIGFYFFYKEDSNLQFSAFIGVSLIIVGMFLVLFSFQRELSRYKKGDGAGIFGNAVTKDKPPFVPEPEKTSATVVCECGTVNAADARFCKKCGKPLHKTCPHCGAEIDADSEFCDKCGEKFGGSENK